MCGRALAYRMNTRLLVNRKERTRFGKNGKLDTRSRGRDASPLANRTIKAALRKIRDGRMRARRAFYSIPSATCLFIYRRKRPRSLHQTATFIARRVFLSENLRGVHLTSVSHTNVRIVRTLARLSPIIRQAFVITCNLRTSMSSKKSRVPMELPRIILASLCRASTPPRVVRSLDAIILNRHRERERESAWIVCRFVLTFRNARQHFWLPAFIPRFVQSRLAADSLYQSHKAFHRRRHSDVSSLSRSPKSPFLADGRPSNAHTRNVFVNGAQSPLPLPLEPWSVVEVGRRRAKGRMYDALI